ncbi:MAG TPA: hypothetical protein VF576_10635 [Rubricoccaceae bacterium]
MRLLLSAVALVALSFATPASAQRPVQQVTRQLDRARATLAGEGYSRDRAYSTASIDEGVERVWTVQLRRGADYVMTGACDSDCSDIDFWLYDPNGDLVDSDTAADDIPVVRVSPGRAGTFRLRVLMASCSVEPCAYGFGVFRQ